VARGGAGGGAELGEDGEGGRERERGGVRRERDREGCPGPGGVAQPRLGYSCLL
jgi:hypothetical protein